MKITVENKIPHLAAWLRAAGVGEVEELPSAMITRDALARTDALMTRTRTLCNAGLLEGTPVRFIGSATIGTDHIDLQWCGGAGITVANAPGCNAPAVAQWVIAAADALNPAEPLEGKRMAVVGMGNVGTVVARYARCCGMEVTGVDPFKGFDTPLAQAVAQADIVTLHTPLTLSGPHPTRHLLDAPLLELMKPGAIVMNAARGAVADNVALARAVAAGRIRAAIDCWEGEPRINRTLLEGAGIATPHIAGYSLQGKLRGSLMVFKAFLDFIGSRAPLPAPMPPVARDVTRAQVAQSYDILADTRALKAAPGDFEALRNNYNLRNET